MKKLLVLVILISLLITVTAFAGSATIQVKSAPLHYSATGWGGWSCPRTHPFIVTGHVAYPNGEIVDPALLLHSLAWKPGASVNGDTYPTTPFGYTYGIGEEGWIAQNNGAKAPLFIVLTCSDTKPVAATVPEGPSPTARPLFQMQLLRKYNPPVGWLPYCIVIADGGVSVDWQIKPYNCGWVADNHPCGGPVYDDNYWRCDVYGFDRLPLERLLRLR